MSPARPGLLLSHHGRIEHTCLRRIVSPMEWISALRSGAGLITLALVIRNELRERRQHPPILWAFNRYGSRTKTDEDGTFLEVLEIAELIQFGRQPTRVTFYHPVGFKFHVEGEYRLRSHIKAEDTLTCLIHDVDPDNAWLLISHFPRDDRRWLTTEWVPLEPTSSAFRDADEASMGRLASEHSRLRARARRLLDRLMPARPVVRPVGQADTPGPVFALTKGPMTRSWTTSSSSTRSLVTSVYELARACLLN